MILWGCVLNMSEIRCNVARVAAIIAILKGESILGFGVLGAA